MESSVLIRRGSELVLSLSLPFSPSLSLSLSLPCENAMRRCSVSQEESPGELDHAGMLIDLNADAICASMSQWVRLDRT